MRERGSSVRYTGWPKPMIRSPASTRSRIHGSIRSAVPMASRVSRARLGAPPCSGPESAPIAPVRQAATSAPVEAITRAVKVEALKPWSTVAIRYRSTARALTGSGSCPVSM